MMSLGCYWNVVLLHMLFIIGKHTVLCIYVDDDVDDDNVDAIRD